MKRIYRFKTYLNASHWVIFDGERGELHPHTWEFCAKIGLLSSELVPFGVYEHAIDAVFAPYQNQTVNEIAPFDTVVPSLESLVEVFGARLRQVVSEFDAVLLEFEGSETPTRSFVIDYSDELVAEPQGDSPVVLDDAGAVFDRLMGELS